MKLKTWFFLMILISPGVVAECPNISVQLYDEGDFLRLIFENESGENILLSDRLFASRTKFGGVGVHFEIQASSGKEYLMSMPRAISGRKFYLPPRLFVGKKYALERISAAYGIGTEKFSIRAIVANGIEGCKETYSNLIFKKPKK